MSVCIYYTLLLAHTLSYKLELNKYFAGLFILLFTTYLLSITVLLTNNMLIFQETFKVFPDFKMTVC